MLEIYCSPLLNAGVFKEKKTTMLKVYDPTVTPAIDVTTDYVGKYGSLANGQKIFVRAKLKCPLGKQVSS